MNELNRKTRIKVKWHFPALSYAICLQRKKWFGWVTVSWTYPSIMKDNTCEYIEHWLFWNETYKKEESSEKNIGNKLLQNCKW